MAFDGSLLLGRTAGQIGSRCDYEAYNALTLNLAVEIIEGRRTVEDARRLYGETAAAFVMGRSAPYAEKLLLTPPGNTTDPDESVIPQSMADQAIEKVKDAFGAARHGSSGPRLPPPNRRVSDAASSSHVACPCTFPSTVRGELAACGGVWSGAAGAPARCESAG
ncbi:hypothetical protein [Streptomyces flavidovirens]|uniref:Uncharacterized protein n=1 Tax=Streptomyces flavidovirens TaxID=67298 RepID=A0ABW6RMJ0_9ACTN